MIHLMDAVPPCRGQCCFPAAHDFCTHVNVHFVKQITSQALKQTGVD